MQALIKERLLLDSEKNGHLNRVRLAPSFRSLQGVRGDLTPLPLAQDMTEDLKLQAKFEQGHGE